jgi:putative copper export protein
VTTADLAPGLDGFRLILHVLAATVWVGGQITVAGLLPTVRRLGPDAPRAVARAFAVVSWPAYAVLLATGIWNVAATQSGQPPAWTTVLMIKVVVVLLAGLSAWLHGRADTVRGRALWGAALSLTSVAALCLGVFLAG